MKKHLLLSGFAVLLPIAVSAAPDSPPEVLELGKSAPDFNLRGVDGDMHELSDFSDAEVLCVIFTCNHCPDSVAARGRMREIHEDYDDQGVAMVAISGNHPEALRPDELGYSPYSDTYPEMKMFAKEAGWEFPYLYDGDEQNASRAYGAQSTPHVFVFGPERKLRYTGRMDDARQSSGPVDESYVRDAIDAVLAGETPSPEKTRSFGCSTKWKYKVDSVIADQKAWENKEVTMEPMDVELAERIRSNDTENVRLINFWSTTCGPCIAEMPDLVETYRRFQNRNFDLVTIALDSEESAGRAQKILENNYVSIAGNTQSVLESENREAINYRFAGENPDNLAEAIDPEWSGALPHSVIVMPGGEIHWRHTGRVEPLELRRKILEALDSTE